MGPASGFAVSTGPLSTPDCGPHRSLVPDMSIHQIFDREFIFREKTTPRNKVEYKREKFSEVFIIHESWAILKSSNGSATDCVRILVTRK